MSQSKIVTARAVAAGLLMCGPRVASPAGGGLPPPTYDGPMLISACYAQSSGGLRIVKPWEPAGCAPPYPYASDPASPGTCTGGGAFDCRASEYFVEVSTLGPAGPAGSRGVPGPKGERGAEGPAGPQGPRGEVGPQGPSARVSPRDPETGCHALGIVDATGSPDPVSPPALACDGAVGPRGPTGDRGEPGPQGAPGPDGAAGPGGAPGIEGPRGAGARVAAEPAGSNCPGAGARITDGLGAVIYVCSPAAR